MKHAIASPLVAAALALAPAAASLPAEELNTTEFLEKFRQSMKLNSKSEMASLVRHNVDTAVQAVLVTCEAIAKQSSDKLENEAAALQSAWETAFDSGFATEQYTYCSSLQLRTDTRQLREQMKSRQYRASKRYTDSRDRENWEGLDEACGDLERIAAGFAELGDYYYSAECWYWVGLGYDEGVRGNLAKIEPAAWAYRNFVAARDELELTDDTIYTQVRSRLKSLEVRGSGPAEAASQGEGPGDGSPTGGGRPAVTEKPGVELGAASTYELEFELLEEIDSIERPNYHSLPLPLLWPAVFLGDFGSVGRIAAFQKGGPDFIRSGAAEVQVDVDHDGVPETTIATTGNITPVEVTVKPREGELPWGFLCTVLGNDAFFQEFQAMLEPTAEYMALYVAPAASMHGEVGEHEVRIIDGNLDGVYGSWPTLWNYQGLSEGHSQPDGDLIVIDGDKRALPWSEFVQLDDDWYRFESVERGKKLQVAPAKVATGTLRLKSKGVSPLAFIVRGEDGGTFANSYFDVTASRKGVEVPVGKYSLHMGLVSEGKRQNVRRCLIIGGEETATWEVTEGEVTTIEVGEPFGFDFDFEDLGDRIKVVGGSITVIGAAGERYERLWNCRVRPEVLLREVGSKKGSRGARTLLIEDQETLNVYGYPKAWHPLDVEVEKKQDGEAVEVQLYEKKNKLFGEIESVWRG